MTENPLKQTSGARRNVRCGVLRLKIYGLT